MEKEPITYKISVKDFLEDVKSKHHGKPIIIDPKKEYEALQGIAKTNHKKKIKRTDYWYYEGKTGSKHKMCNEIWDVCIIVQANNEEEARKRYDECVKRHSLIPLDDPEFVDVTSDDYINDWEEIFLPEDLAEMDKHGTMLVYSKVCNY